MSDAPRHILLVCSGNTCRSPLAAAILTARIAATPELRGIMVASAGTAAWDGAPASEGSYLVALERGLDLSAHQARQVTTDTIRDADLILTMGAAHAQRIGELGGARKVQLLTSYAGEPGTDVVDPYGQDVEVYRATADELDRLMAKVVARLRREQAA